MSYMLAVDIGGTFTDLAAYDVDAGTLSYTKSPTTYDNLSLGICRSMAYSLSRPSN